MTYAAMRNAAIEALAECWASMDGKLDEFRAGKASKSDPGGHYQGYWVEASDVLQRLETRGFTIKPTEPA